MGAVQGHMSHLYDNPNLRFGQIKDILNKASTGELIGTEKTDGQNIMLSYNIKAGNARASRNKGHFKQGGLTPDELQAFFGGRGKLEHSFADSFRAFEQMAQNLPLESQLKLFGPEANIYYNAEVQDPRTSNVINYDVATLTIHRSGHGEYDKKTGNLVNAVGEENATHLEKLLNRSEDEIEGADYRVQVNAIRKLEALANDSALDEALVRIGRFMNANGLDDDNTIGQYLVGALDRHVTSEIPELRRDAKKLLLKRMFEEGYGTEVSDEGRPKRKTTQKAIAAELEDPELFPQVKQLIAQGKTIIEEAVYPLEDIIHDFTVEMLRGLESAFILDNEGELKRQRNEVAKAITAIENSDNEEAMRILQQQMRKLKRIENMTTAAEGFVFDYDGHTYKFTGNFAPANQILGLFKYGRKGVPPLKALDAEEVLAEGLQHAIMADKPWIALYPGKFKPPHAGHLGVVRSLAGSSGVGKVVVLVSPRIHEGITPEQSKQIWDIFLSRLSWGNKVEVVIPDSVSPVGAVYDYIDNPGLRHPLLLAVGEKDEKDGRYASAVERGKTRLERLNQEPIEVIIDAIPPQASGLSATDLRNALETNSRQSLKNIREKLPDHLNTVEKDKVMKILLTDREAAAEMEGPPLAEGFRATDLYRLIDEVLDEMSSMAAGNVQGGMIGTGSKKGPWAELDTEAENEKQKKNAELNDKEELIAEIENYLLNSEVTL